MHLSLFLSCPRSSYGSPLSRRRIFIIMVRDDVLAPLGKKFDTFILEKLRSMMVPCTTSWKLVNIQWTTEAQDSLLSESMLITITSLWNGQPFFFSHEYHRNLRTSLLLPYHHFAVAADRRARELRRRVNSERHLDLTYDWPLCLVFFQTIVHHSSNWSLGPLSVMQNGYKNIVSGQRIMRPAMNSSPT